MTVSVRGHLNFWIADKGLNLNGRFYQLTYIRRACGSLRFQTALLDLRLPTFTWLSGVLVNCLIVMKEQ